MSMKGKKIVLGITGSIAAYKAAILIRGLIKKGAEVQVVITPAGKEFITPITLSALTSKPVISEFFAQRDGTWNSHVDLGLWADAMIIAPATASTIGKMANGIADNMLITTYLSMKAPVFVAPAMDLDMFAHPSTRKNLDTLRSYGNHIIEPAEGELASHLVGRTGKNSGNTGSYLCQTTRHGRKESSHYRRSNLRKNRSGTLYRQLFFRKNGIRTCRRMRFTWSGSITNQRTGNDSGPSP